MRVPPCPSRGQSLLNDSFAPARWTGLPLVPSQLATLIRCQNVLETQAAEAKPLKFVSRKVAETTFEQMTSRKLRLHGGTVRGSPGGSNVIRKQHSSSRDFVADNFRRAVLHCKSLGASEARTHVLGISLLLPPDLLQGNNRSIEMCMSSRFPMKLALM